MNGAFILVLFVVSLGVSFLMSGMEAGVFSMSRLRIRQQVRTGNPRAAVLLGYLEHPEHFLWTILVGNTLANLTAVSLAVLTLHAWLGRWEVYFWGAVVMSVVLFYALCDLLPKMLFRTYPNRLCMAMVLPFRVVARGMRPLVWGVEVLSGLWLRWTGGARFTGHLFGSRDELRLLMQETGQSLSSEERAMINRVLDLQNRAVSEISIPLEKAVMIGASAPLSELLSLRRERGFSRYPVYRVDGGQRRVVGFVNCKRVLYETPLDLTRPVSEFLKPSLFLDGAVRLDAALLQMQRTGHRLAVVLGPENREIGIVSLTDILQTIFGEVRL
jgi:CBS domain containing-hemolysin-like protein